MAHHAETVSFLTTRIKRKFLIWLLVFVSVSVSIQMYSRGYDTDRGNNADEAAHFVSSIVIADYLSAGAPVGPISFAKNYYAHFPKVAIGHWPPVFELTQAVAFLVLGRTGTVAIMLQALIAGLCIAIPAAYLSRYIGTIGGIVAGCVVLFSPTFLPMLDLVMSDTLLAVFTTLAAITWSWFYHERSWRSAVLFALTAAATILTKGTGFGLVMLPLIYLAAKRDLMFLLNLRIAIAGALVAVLTLPWYAFTYRMAADGFAYGWGWDYTRLAVPFFLRGLVASLGLPCLIAFAIGVVLCWRSSDERSPKQPDIAAFAATALAMLTFSMVAPADLDWRYLIPTLPCIAIVAVWGLSRTMEQVTLRKNFKQVLVAAVFSVSIATVFTWPQPRSFQAQQLVQAIQASTEPNPLVLVSGSPEAEGAFISSFAERDLAGKYYIIRAQKALAETNWTATDYRLKFDTAVKMVEWINQVKIGWLVLDTDSVRRDFEHSAMLRSAIGQGLLPAKLVSTSAHPGGRMELYSLLAVSVAPAVSESLAATLVPGHLGGL